jgi:hypothetical protein
MAARGQELPGLCGSRLIQAVVDCTLQIVELSGKADWRAVDAAAAQRRDLLARLRAAGAAGRHAGCISALDGAVRESDAFLALLPRSR